jgi:hypothetical protein
MLKQLIAAGMVLLPLSVRAVTFSGAQTVSNEWSYTLTYAPLDNYSIFEPVTTITLSGLAGVTAAAGPLSADFPDPSLNQINTNWTAEVLSGGTVVRWTHVGSGTGNFSTEQHVFGFRIFASGATNGLVSVVTSGFSRDTSQPLPGGGFELDIATTTVGPVGASGDSDGDGVPDNEDECPSTPADQIVNSHGCSIQQLVPCSGPQPGVSWRNHGKYVSTMVRTIKRFLAEGLITKAEARELTRAAARSNCGKKH